MDKVAELRDWTKVEVAGSKYVGTDNFVLSGYIFNDPKGRFPDGTLVRTSLVKTMEEGYAETMNTLYKLGRPNEK